MLYMHDQFMHFYMRYIDKYITWPTFCITHANLHLICAILPWRCPCCPAAEWADLSASSARRAATVSPPATTQERRSPRRLVSARRRSCRGSAWRRSCHVMRGRLGALGGAGDRKARALTSPPGEPSPKPAAIQTILYEIKRRIILYCYITPWWQTSNKTG